MGIRVATWNTTEWGDRRGGSGGQERREWGDRRGGSGGGVDSTCREPLDLVWCHRGRCR